MFQVNLLAVTARTPEARTWPARGRLSTLAGLSLVMLITVTAGGWWYELRAEERSLDARIHQVETERSYFKATAGLVEQATARRNEIAERLSLIERLRTSKRVPAALLEALSRSLPDGVWLSELQQSGASVRVEGFATSIASITEFADGLRTSGSFALPVEILSTATETVEAPGVIRFVLSTGAAGLSPPDAPSGPARSARPVVNAPATRRGP